MNQHEFIVNCLQFYEEAGMTPEKGWEKAHYPVPKCKDGTETVWLTHDHHAIHGVLQSLEFGVRCFFPLTHSERLRIFSGPWEWLLEDYDRIQSEDSRKLAVHLPHDSKQQSIAGKRGGKARAAQPSFRDHQRKAGRNGGRTNVESGHLQSISSKGGKITNSQKWRCLVTGYISSPGPLSCYQRARGIDTSLRERVHFFGKTV